MSEVAVAPEANTQQYQQTTTNTSDDELVGLSILDDYSEELDKDEQGLFDDEVPENYEYNSEYNSLKLFWANLKGMFFTTKVRWRQHYYFYIHIFLIIFGSLSFAFLLYVIEHKEGGSNIPYIDALFSCVSMICGVGLLTFDHTLLTFKGQLLLLTICAIGGICITTIPALLILMFQAHKRMMESRAKVKRKEMEVTNQLFINQVLLAEELEEQRKAQKRAEDDRMSRLAMRLNSMMEDVVLKKKKKTDVVPHTDVEYYALVWLVFFIVTTVLVINSVAALIQLLVLRFAYDSAYLEGKDPLWISLFQTITGFNNCGLTVFSDNLMRFQTDYTICTVLMIVLMSGNTMFPFILRNVIVLSYKLGGKHKRCFKYLLNKHHHVSIHLYPSLQTRIYVAITFILQLFGAFYGSYVEYNNPIFGQYTYGQVLFICYFHVVSSRAAGFTTIDLSKFSIPFLLYIIILMRTKAQMACDLKGQAYGIVKTEKELKKDTEKMKEVISNVIQKIPLRDLKIPFRKNLPNQPVEIYVTNPQDEPIDLKESKHTPSVTFEDVDISPNSPQSTLDFDKSSVFLTIPTKEQNSPRIPRQSSFSESLEDLFPASPPTNSAENKPITRSRSNEPIDISKIKTSYKTSKTKHKVRKLKSEDDILELEEDAEYSVDVKRLSKKQQAFYFINLFFKKLWYHTSNLIAKNNVWLVLVVLLICMIEEQKMVQAPQNWSLLKIIFEVVSAFGTSGLSVGYPGINTSFSSVFSNWSKLLIILVMFCGKHRGLSGSMKDQEYSQYKKRMEKELEFEKKKEEELRQILRERKKKRGGWANFYFKNRSTKVKI